MFYRTVLNASAFTESVTLAWRQFFTAGVRAFTCLSRPFADNDMEYLLELAAQYESRQPSFADDLRVAVELTRLSAKRST
jgi:hypothetical protein